MKLRIKCGLGRLMPFGDGLTLYPFVLFKARRGAVAPDLFRHEMQHVYQVRRLGWARFYLRYAFFTMRFGYWKNPFEVEAYARQSDALTDTERELFREYCA